MVPRTPDTLGISKPNMPPPNIASLVHRHFRTEPDQLSICTTHKCNKRMQLDHAELRSLHKKSRKLICLDEASEMSTRPGIFHTKSNNTDSPRSFRLDIQWNRRQGSSICFQFKPFQITNYSQGGPSTVNKRCTNSPED